MKKTSSNKERRFISYFQSVITIGIMSRAKNEIEAEEKALHTMKSKHGVNYCAFDQTPFELSDTEEWKPELEIDPNEEKLVFKFSPDEKTRNIIATRLGKDISALTDDDIQDFVKTSIDASLRATK